MEEIWPAVLTNLQPHFLLTLLIGTVIGTILGALPGIGTVAALALLLPFTFEMEPAQGLVMLAAVYMSAEFGGSIPAILIRAPGIPGAAATMLDGYPMTLKGEAKEALYLQLFAGVVGGAIGAAVLLFFTPLLAGWALLMGPAEYFWIAVTGLALVATLSGRHIVKGLLAAALGVFLTIPGQDLTTGQYRFVLTDLHFQFSIGFPMVPAMIGLFAIASVLDLVGQRSEKIAPLARRPGVMREVLRRVSKMKFLLLRSSAIGTAVGMLPGAAAATAAFIAYGDAKRGSRRPQDFGKGNWEGVAAPEAANNALVGGTMIPLLALGIPGSAAAAVLLGTLTIHGMLPGPRLFVTDADVVYIYMVGMSFTVVAMLIFGVSTIRYSSLTTQAPIRFMAPFVIAVATFGTYSLRNTLYDVGIMIAFGVIGYLLDKAGIKPVPLALGLVLGNMIEDNFQRMVTVSGIQADGVWSYMFGRPIAVILMLLALFILVSGVVQAMKPVDDEDGAEQANSTTPPGADDNQVDVVAYEQGSSAAPDDPSDGASEGES